MAPLNMDDLFPEAFKLARQESGLSQAEVAARMTEYGYEMSQPVIGKIERGERRVSIGEGEALGKIVGRSAREMLEGPVTLRLDLGVEYLASQRIALKEAIERFQSAQLVVASFIDESLRKPDEIQPLTRSRFDLAMDLLEETPREVLDEYEKDTRAAMQAFRLRDELDTEERRDTEVELGQKSALAQEPSTVSRLQSARGDALNSLISALGYVDAMRSMRLRDAPDPGDAKSGTQTV